MNAAKVISINPSVKTLGEFNFSHQTLESVSRSLSNPGSSEISLKKTINFILGINSKATKTYSRNILITRVCAGISMILIALAGYSPVLLCLLGITLILGLFNRVSAFAGAVAFSSIYFSLLPLGEIAEIYLALAALSGIICYFGPGRFSIDMVIKKQIFRSLIRNRRNETSENDLFSYKAYSKIGK